MKIIKIADYNPRLEKPTKDNLYYVSNKYGGYSPCIIGKPNANNGKSVLANCVGYAFMEWWEQAGENTLVGCLKGMTKPPTAKYWYTKGVDGYERTQTPKVGAVACFRPSAIGSGHVAIITDIQKDYIQLAESGYNGYMFRTVKAYRTYCLITYNGKTTRHYNYKYNHITKKLTKTFNVLQGYVIPPFIDYTVEPLLKVGDKVEIIASGNSKADGTGKMIKGIGWEREILDVVENALYPYKVGNSKKVLTGYYKESALKKI